MSANMTDLDNIEICTATINDGDRLLSFLHSHYYREEPLTIGCEPPLPDDEDEKFQLSNLPHSTCLLAVQDNRIVGAVVAGPKLPDEAEHLYEEAKRLEGTNWGRILGILERVERDANVFVRYNVDKALHMHCLGVDATLRGCRIGERLTHALARRGKELGYPIMTSDCTSCYSSRLMKRLGMELINTLRYTDYVDATTGEQVICPPAPHEQIDTFVMKL